ncbi:peritrophin-1-like [Artemia franciscana]|uniref:peritrophin-1-like n=1 Tax=Artemia franciscana TaxID=6661 RepID=UPI0032D9E4CB
MKQAFIVCLALAVIANGKNLRRSNECPEVDGDYPVYFPYPGDCERFIQCTNGWENYFNCPSGLVFDTNLNVCNYPENVDGECGTNPEEPPTTEGQLETTIEESDESTSSEAETEDTGVETTQLPTTETDPEGSGSVESICPEVDGDYALHIPHESDCTMFYKCDRGTPELKVCPHNLWFNAALQVCDWPAQSGCEM